MTRLATLALAYHAAGLCVLPARAGEKRPAVTGWKEFQSRLPTSTEVSAWFANPHDACCLVCGAVSGNVELLDFDGAGLFYEPWRQAVAAEAPTLLDRLVVERSPSGGLHVVYRCAEPVSGNLKLAQSREDLPGPDEVVRYGKRLKPRKDSGGRWHIVLTLIETRGEGGLFLCAPSTGYTLIQGDFAALPVLTAAERDVVLRAAWTLNEVPPQVIDGPPPPPATGLRPGDDYNRRADVAGVLQHHGWSLARDGENQCWSRPGKTGGTSATLKGGVLYVFSSNAEPFEGNRAYSPFAVFALLEHQGDFAAAAMALRELGYGDAAPQSDPAVGLTGVLPASAAPLNFDLQTFADTPERQISWLWPGVIPRGMLSLIGGKQGLGKSFLICDLAARVSAGKPMPDGLIHAPANVLLLAREDDASCVLLPRLKAAGADLAQVSWSIFANRATGAPLDLAGYLALLVEAVKDKAFDLIVVDTFAAFAPAGTDANAAQDVRVLLDALSRLARQTGAAVVVVAHLRKNGQGDGDAMDAVAGSTQMTAGVRVAAMLDKGVQTGERWFRVVKSNLGAINDQGWTWRFVYDDPLGERAGAMPRIEWGIAGETYAALEADRLAGRARVDPAEVRAALVDCAAAHPLTPRVALARVWSRLRTSHRDLKKIDLEGVIDDLFHTPGDGLVVGIGSKGARLIGRPGMLPESPEALAYRLATEDPTKSYRQLAELAGCRNQTAREALRDARDRLGLAGGT